MQALMQSITSYPVICVFGFDVSCYNYTNVTRQEDTSQPVDIAVIAGSVIVSLCGVALITVSIVFCTRIKPHKKHVIKVRIDHPDKRRAYLADMLHKNRLKQNGTYYVHRVL